VPRGGQGAGIPFLLELFPLMPGSRYPSSLSDGQWAVVSPLLPPAKPGGRPRTVNLRLVLDAIFYVNKTGCQWRQLPREFGPWQTVYHYFRQWRLDGTADRLHAALRDAVRRAAGRAPAPSAVVIDSRSAKTAEKGGPAVTIVRRRSSGARITL
jgi:putative transposase